MLPKIRPCGAGAAENRQAQFLERAGIAVLSRLDFWRIAPTVILVHFGGQLDDLRTKRLFQGNAFSSARLTVIQRSFRDRTAQHFFKAHGLRAELKPVSIVDLAAPAFLLNRVGLPKPFLAVQSRAALASDILYNIAGAVDPKA